MTVCGRFTVKMTWAEIVRSIDWRSSGCQRLKRQGNAARSRHVRDCRYVIFCNHASVAKRLPNKDLRTREHLTEAEVERLIEATRDNRDSHRDATMVLPSCTSAGSSRAPQHASDPRRRIARLTSAPARAGAQVAVRVHFRGRRAVHHRWLRQNDRASWKGGQAVT
jgi:hypothetical protein